MNCDPFDGFTVDLAQDETGRWLARLQELPVVSAFSASPRNAVTELEQAWQKAKEIYRNHDEPIPASPAIETHSTTFNLRIGKRLYHALALEAEEAGISMNELITRKLARSI